MDQNKAKILADEGLELIGAERYDEAESKYLEALKLIDPNHWSTQDIHGQFGMLLSKMGRNAEALEQYDLSLQSALHCYPPESVSVTLARYFLADCYMRQEKYGETIKAVKPSLEIDCENKWLVCFVAAQIHYKLGDEGSSDYYASQVLLLAPKGKYSSLSELKKSLASNI